MMNKILSRAPRRNSPEKVLELPESLLHTKIKLPGIIQLGQTRIPLEVEDNAFNNYDFKLTIERKPIALCPQCNVVFENDKERSYHFSHGCGVGAKCKF
jgi:hypothetical protein